MSRHPLAPNPVHSAPNSHSRLEFANPARSTGTQGLQKGVELLAAADTLERPNHLAVHGHRPGQCIDLPIALEGNNSEARVPEKRGRRRTHRPHADNGNVVAQHRNSRTR